MTLFFLVVGLEARKEFVLGDLRERSRLVLPVTARLIAMAVPVGIYLAVNHGGPAAHGWGVAMSTDSALALGAFAMVARGVPDQVRAFLLALFVVDDVAALLLVIFAYGDAIRPAPAACARFVQCSADRTQVGAGRQSPDGPAVRGGHVGGPDVQRHRTAGRRPTHRAGHDRAGPAANRPGARDRPGPPLS